MAMIRHILGCLLLLCAGLTPIAAWASQVVPSARVSTAVLVRDGPSTDTAIRARLRPGDPRRRCPRLV